MSGKYYSITGNESLLQQFVGSDRQGLKVARVREAEKAADVFIDVEFSDWDTTLFAVVGDVPLSIALIAEKIAVAEYWRLGVMTNGRDPYSNDESGPFALKQEAVRLKNKILDRGHVVANDGSKIVQDDGSEDSEMFVEIAV